MKRVRQTLEGFENVDKVDFVPDCEQFEVEYRSESPRGDEFQRAVSAVVIFPDVRRFLGGVGERLHN